MVCSKDMGAGSKSGNQLGGRVLEVKHSDDRPDLVNLGHSSRRSNWLAIRGRGGAAIGARPSSSSGCHLEGHGGGS
jgi:hypothetical protein